MLILVGPSACGKTEIAKALKIYGVEKIITYTTRLPRIGEINNLDYHFVTKDEFIKLKSENFFFETACYNEKYYGTSNKDLSLNRVLIVEPNGLEYFNSNFNEFYSIFINVDENIRKNRMICRKDDQIDINNRIIKDKITFDLNNIDCDYVYDYNNESIIELTKNIYNIYKTNFLNKKN